MSIPSLVGSVVLLLLVPMEDRDGRSGCRSSAVSRVLSIVLLVVVTPMIIRLLRHRQAENYRQYLRNNEYLVIKGHYSVYGYVEKIFSIATMETVSARSCH